VLLADVATVPPDCATAIHIDVAAPAFRKLDLPFDICLMALFCIAQEMKLAADKDCFFASNVSIGLRLRRIAGAPRPWIRYIDFRHILGVSAGFAVVFYSGARHPDATQFNLELAYGK
jgi:hypothetical protein